MKFTKASLFLLTIAILFTCSFVAASGQGFSTVVGTVTDPSGSLISGAKVTVTDQGTQASRSVMSSDQGYFVIPALHPSTYDVSVTASGFATHEQKGVSLLADQSLTLDVKMTIGQITETVSIQTSGVQVRADAYKLLYATGV
jgi:hypothetical protein